MAEPCREPWFALGLNACVSAFFSPLYGDLSRYFPFHGFVERLRSSLTAHHDQANCRGCDFLGRICGASKAKAMIRNFCGHNGMILLFKNLPDSDAWQSLWWITFLFQVCSRVVGASRIDWSNISVLQIWGFALKEWFDIVFLLCDEDDGSTRVLVNDVIKEVQVSMQQRGYPPVHVQKMDIRPRRNNSFRSQDEIQAQVPFRTSRLRIQG